MVLLRVNEPLIATRVRAHFAADYAITTTLSVVSDLLEFLVGILLCKPRNRVVIEYALKNFNQPIAVSTCGLEKKGFASLQTITEGLARIMEK